jgi:integrating conjugative element protein (TIGR03749 family)
MSAAGSADNTDNAFNEDIGSAKTDRVVFNQVPVRVVLRAGRERILSFPNPVTLNIPEDLQALISPLDIIGKSIYMTPIAPFARTRVTVQDLVTGQIIPLDLQAASGAVTSGILDIFYAGDTNRTSQHGKATVNGPDADDTEHEPAIDMVALTRYASHRLYAPQRLLTPVPGIRQVNVSTKPATGLYRGSAALLETTPIGAWRSQDLYVTAVKFVNRGKAPVELDLNELRGHWIAATAQHVRLAGMGSEDDTTAVYLVSARPFEESR